MNKSKLLTLTLSAAMLSAAYNPALAQQAKYVFYFIGDGMGQNQVQLTELYRGEMEGKIGLVPLLFTQFPYASIASTYSSTNGVTDSAASGTALATGSKTANGCIGVASDKKTPLKSIAYRAKEAGKRVGVSSSVAINHATPAAFYGHNESRKNYNDIAMELGPSGFDFFGGADFWGAVPEDSLGVFNNSRRHGYTIVRGYDEFRKNIDKADKIILLQDEETSKIDERTIPYTIDRQPGNLTLPEITQAGIDFLMKDAPNGFFFMIEGGNIDWECHSNDAAPIIHEIQDFDNAIGIAYEFYKKHPDETLIVVTADHETGSLCLGTGPYVLNLKALSNQKVSELQFTRILNQMRKENKGVVTKEMADKALAEYFGFGTALQLNDKQKARLDAAYEESFGPKVELVESEYQAVIPLATEAKRIINEIAYLGWGSGGHSASFVPVYAVGAGADAFTARTDNAGIARIISNLGGYPVTD